MEQLKLNDGTVLANSSLVQGDPDLFIYMNGITFAGAFNQLIESRKTKKIIYTRNSGDQVVCSGYTRLTALRDEGDGYITAVLRKETR